MKRFNYFFLLYPILTVMNSSLYAQPSAITQPPIPNSIIETIYDLHHPFLLYDRKGFRDSRRLVKDEPFQERAKEFFARAAGYSDKKSFWFVGEGPFSASPSFEPMMLNEEDFSAYCKVLMDIAAYIGIEQERLDINRIQDEFLRILDQIETYTESNENGLAFSYRRAQLMAVGALLYDMVYMRFDTVDRHEPTRRFKTVRDQLASFCRIKNMDDFSPHETTVYGAALGLSSLFCISVYPDEWERSHEFAVQSLLPDMYLAAQWTRAGMTSMVSDRMQFISPANTVDLTLLITIPWTECMKRLGYPYVVESGSFSRIANALQTHRIPGTANMVQPFLSKRSASPWLPLDVPLFTSDPLAEQLIASATDVEAEEELLYPGEEPEEEKKDDSFSSKLNEQFSNQGLTINTSPLAMTLREQLETLMQPRPDDKKKKPITPAEPQILEGGWLMPNREKLPSLWGTVYMLAAFESPRSPFREVWTDNAIKYDSHPYPFLYWKPFPKARTGEQGNKQFVQYPLDGFTLFAETTPYGDFMMASQASRETIMRGTYIAQTESYFMSENTINWRWVHEIPVVATKVLSASEIQTVTETEEYLNLMHDRLQSLPVSSITPELSLQTSMYSCWETESPTGKTIVVRRHISGIGSTYNITAHFPDANADHHLKYINFKLEPGADTGIDQEVPGKLLIRPKEAKEHTEPISMEEARFMRNEKKLNENLLQTYGILHILFSPDSLQRASFSEGVMGQFFETAIAKPLEPFFYITSVDQPGREMFAVKYGALPMPGLRFIEWKNGLEIIAINTGSGIDNTFIKSDADLVLVSRDQSMGGVFYLMVNGTELQAKYSPRQRDWTTLARVDGEPVTVSWNQRRLHSSSVPQPGSAFYAPEILGFETPKGRIPFGKKSRQAVVLRE